jgi:hypothetical protein
MSPIPSASNLERTAPAVSHMASASGEDARSDLTPLSLGEVIHELAVLEDAHRALNSRARGAATERERRRLTARQRVVLRELRHRARHRVRLRPGTPDVVATSDPDGMPTLDQSLKDDG